MSCNHDLSAALESFFDDGSITEVLYEVKSGKEATVFCCRGGEAARRELLAAKVYRPLESRRFKNDAIYHTGRMHLARNGRARRAAENKSAFGREIQYATWIDHEWQTMNLLFEHGADVPQPLARNDRAILMPFLGNESGAAPILHDADLDRIDTQRVADRLLWNIELMLHLDRVHGDLSPYNVLYHAGKAVIIDFPQAVDPRLNPAGRQLLWRDVENVCRWAGRSGVQRDADRIARQLWQRFRIGEIG
jgi:RIO kinase 1